MTLVFSSLIFQCVRCEPQRMCSGILTSTRNYNLPAQEDSQDQNYSLFSHSHICSFHASIMGPSPHFCHVKAIHRSEREGCSLLPVAYCDPYHTTTPEKPLKTGQWPNDQTGGAHKEKYLTMLKIIYLLSQL